MGMPFPTNSAWLFAAFAAWVVIVQACGCHPMRLCAQDDVGASAGLMAYIDLQDGFQGEPVVVRIDGREVFSSESVLTDFRIGFAESFEVKGLAGTIELEVHLPAHAVTKRLRVDIDKTPYIGVSVTQDGRVQLRVGAEPFGYV